MAARGRPTAYLALARVLTSHHHDFLPLYRFVRETLEGGKPLHRQAAFGYVRRQQAWANEINTLARSFRPSVRTGLRRYLMEVAKVAGVIRLESMTLNTNKRQLDAVLSGVLRDIGAARKAEMRRVADRHTGTTL
jgi:hypothetical protein